MGFEEMMTRISGAGQQTRIARPVEGALSLGGTLGYRQSNVDDYGVNFSIKFCT
jgi:hypothetical protein